MKVVLKDKFMRENVDDVLLRGNLTEEQADELADMFNVNQPEYSTTHAVAEEDDYEL